MKNKHPQRPPNKRRPLPPPTHTEHKKTGNNKGNVGAACNPKHTYNHTQTESSDRKAIKGKPSTPSKHTTTPSNLKKQGNTVTGKSKRATYNKLTKTSTPHTHTDNDHKQGRHLRTRYKTLTHTLPVIYENAAANTWVNDQEPPKQSAADCHLTTVYQAEEAEAPKGRATEPLFNTKRKSVQPPAPGSTTPPPSTSVHWYWRVHGQALAKQSPHPLPCSSTTISTPPMSTVGTNVASPPEDRDLEVPFLRFC